MKVWKRILIKTLLFAVVAAAAGAGGVAWKESSREIPPDMRWSSMRSI